jgi:hypothetical protein
VKNEWAEPDQLPLPLVCTGQGPPSLLTLAGAHSPQLLDLPDVVLDQGTNGLIAIACRRKAEGGYNKEGSEDWSPLALRLLALYLPPTGWPTRAFPQRNLYKGNTCT